MREVTPLLMRFWLKLSWYSLEITARSSVFLRYHQLSYSLINNNPCGGVRDFGRWLAGASDLASRCVRIFSIISGSSMQAMILTSPPQGPQVETSILKTRLSLSAHVSDLWLSANEFWLSKRGFSWRGLWHALLVLHWFGACCWEPVHHGIEWGWPSVLEPSVTRPRSLIHFLFWW